MPPEALETREALARGIQIPQQISLVGFDDTQLARSARLASVRQPLRELGQRAARLLVASVDVALMAQNVAIAAESEGLGICYIGGIRNKPAEVAAICKSPVFRGGVMLSTKTVCLSKTPSPRVLSQRLMRLIGSYSLVATSSSM